MTASPTLPQSHAIRKSGVLILSGYGIRVQVHAGHLLAHDGIADERRTIRLPRVNHGLKRLVIIGSDGFISLEALRWISDVGAAFLLLDRKGKVLAVTGPVAPSDSKLRRAQSLALGNGTALKISKELISQKLAGQELLVRDMLHDSATADAIGRFRTTLPTAESVERVTLIEAQAAKLFWHSWADLPILWPRKDETRVPDHWKRFASRISPLTHSPRLAVNPPNALLNFLYGLLEGEARLSAVAMGMDPAIGFLHVDTPNRDSLACDLMEVCRPGGVDGFVLNWLQSEPLRKSDFWEDRKGNCRIASSLAIKLCETSETWRRLVAPVAEYVAQEIWSSASKPTSKTNLTRQLVATRLTQQNKREVKGSNVPEVKRPKPQHVCSGCGKPINAERNHCATCAIDGATERLGDAARIGRVAARSPEARAKHVASRRRHAEACSAWDASKQPNWLTSEMFSQRIQPLLTDVSTSASVLPLSRGAPSENYPKSNAAARKALELDATLAQAHATLGKNEMEYDWDFAGGRAEFKKAFELDPNDATAHQWYAYDIGWIGGREQEALAEANRAHQLDPLSPLISYLAGYIQIMARQYDEGIAVCKKFANENPTFARVHLRLAYAYWGKRMYPQVIEEQKAYGQLSGDRNESDFASAMERGFHSGGWKGALAKGIEIRHAQRKTGYSSAYQIAVLYADLGDKEQAFRWLNTAYQERDWLLLGLKTDFLLDPLRSDPRFVALVRKVGLPQ